MGLFGKKTSVGLDIGSGLVEGVVIDPGIVSDAIRTALKEAGIKAKHVVTAVGGRDVIIKKIQIDRVKESEVRDLMEGKARILADAGLNPACIDVDAFALHNAFELNYPDAMNGIVALVNIG